MTALSQILSLARAGNPARAWDLFIAEGLADDQTSFKTLTLKGRLLKDQAKRASGSDQVRLYGEAASTYQKAADLEADSYPLINAATLALLAGKPSLSIDLAEETLALIGGDPTQGENAYWRAATRSEALLLTGEEAAARAALKDGIEHIPNAWEDHAATIGQFELILAAQGKDTDWLNRFRPPPSLYFGGLIVLDENDPNLYESIKRYIENEKPGFGFGALAAGSDIMIAECLHRAGAELRITLPYDIDRFRELSVEPFGANWSSRFDSILASASTVDTLPDIPSADERALDHAVALANQMAMGQCIRNASILRSEVQALSVIEVGQKSRAHFDLWTENDHKLFEIEAKRPGGKKAMQRTVSEQHDTKISATLWIGSVAQNIVNAQLPSYEEYNGGYYVCSDDWLDLVSIAHIFVEQNEAAKSCLLLDVQHGDLPSAILLDQLVDIAQASQGGVILTDYKSAMALTLSGVNYLIQEIGELKTAYGPIPIWSIS